MTAPHTEELPIARRFLSRIAQDLPEAWRFQVFGLPSAVVETNLDEVVSGYKVEPRGASQLHHVPNGIAWSRGAHLDYQYRLLLPISYGMNRDMLYWMYKRQRLFPKVRQLPDECISLIGDGHENYYHWLHDIVPKLAALDPDRIPHYHYLACQQSPFHRQTLELLGIPRKAITPTRPFSFYRSKHLLVPQTPIGPNASSIQFLREQLVHRLGSRLPQTPVGPRFYISRRNTGSRRLVNEESLLQQLKPLGFEVVTTETLTLAQQIALFQQAEMIISPTGAALANLVFCRPGTRLLILMPEGCDDYLYRDIAKEAGLNALLQFVPLAPGADPDPVKSDFVLDTADLESLHSNLCSLGLDS